jgi:hypothetical protein
MADQARLPTFQHAAIQGIPNHGGVTVNSTKAAELKSRLRIKDPIRGRLGNVQLCLAILARSGWQ